MESEKPCSLETSADLSKSNRSSGEETTSCAKRSRMRDRSCSTKNSHLLIFDNQRNEKRPLWTVSDVAMYLRVSERTVRDWVYKRVVPYRKVGAAVRFSPDEIERWTLP